MQLLYAVRQTDRQADNHSLVTFQAQKNGKKNQRQAKKKEENEG